MQPESFCSWPLGSGLHGCCSSDTASRRRKSWRARRWKRLRHRSLRRQRRPGDSVPNIRAAAVKQSRRAKPNRATATRYLGFSWGRACGRSAAKLPSRQRDTLACVLARFRRPGRSAALGTTRHQRLDRESFSISPAMDNSRRSVPCAPEIIRPTGKSPES